MNNDMNYNAGEKNSSGSGRRVLKSGSYTVGVCAIVIAIVVAVNFVVSAIPSTKTQIDMSKESLYTVGDTTKEMLDNIKDEVNLYLICEEGSENITVSKMLTSYGELFDNITVKTIDPAVNPNFTSEYTNESLSSNSIIAVSDKRSTVIKYADMFRYDVEGYAEMSASEYNQLMQQYYYTYGTTVQADELFTVSSI